MDLKVIKTYQKVSILGNVRGQNRVLRINFTKETASSENKVASLFIECLPLMEELEKSLPLVLIVSDIKPAHDITSDFLIIRFHIFIPSKPQRVGGWKT